MRKLGSLGHCESLRSLQQRRGADCHSRQGHRKGLEVHLITDSGRTEFHGQPTRTCLAIGPDDAAKIDQVTGHLELLIFCSCLIEIEGNRVEDPP